MNTVGTHKNPDFWIFGLFFFSTFSSWQPVSRFCPSGCQTLWG
ncbi:hypothetical protein O5814_23185 [Escherichia coli]|nr:hypothetical protein [Escherichia coli]